MTEPLLALIRKYESDGAIRPQGVETAYDVVSSFIPDRHRTKHPLSTYPVSEVLSWQEFVVDRGAKSSAAGAYQIIRRTLLGLFPAGTQEVQFDAGTQDAAATALLLGRGLAKAQAGEITAIVFANNLSKEWASLPVQWDQAGALRWVKRGQSYYQGDGLNAAHCPPKEVMTAVLAVLEASTPVTITSRVEALEAAVAILQEAVLDGDDGHAT